jgi:hypothetical protein
MQAHPDKAIWDELFPTIRRYQQRASKHGIGDIFQENGSNSQFGSKFFLFHSSFFIFSRRSPSERRKKEE